MGYWLASGSAARTRGFVKRFDPRFWTGADRRGPVDAGPAARRCRAPGDVLAMAAGPAQIHLGIFARPGLVHGEVGLRRVVERPNSTPWPVIQSRRLRED